jgi:4-hydroxy-tetrahydrodipicolinate synthase
MEVKDITLWTALVTPFKEDLTVDYEALEALIKEQEEAGNGLLILGSTGEGLNIGSHVKKDIIEFVKGQNPKVPVMAGVGGHDLVATKSWVQWLETQNVDAYLMVVPMYAKPGTEGQLDWFTSLMDEVSKPVMLYNVPGRTAKALELDAVDKLKSHENFWAIKEASGSVDKFSAYLEVSDNAMVYCGDDGLFPDFADAGSCGLVSVASNAWPKETNLYVQKCLEKNFEDNDLWTEAADSLFTASNPVPVKRLLKNEGRINSDILMPPLSRKDLKDDSALERASKVVREWYSEHRK